MHAVQTPPEKWGRNDAGLAWGTEVGPWGGASVDVAKGTVRAGERTAGWIDTRTEVEAGEGYGKGLGTGRANIQIPG